MTDTNKENIEILRFTTVGSVDDGKSTLIGRLLLDTESVFEDQIAAIEKTSAKKGHEGIDLALVTDGLAAEREQGITIDVAYRYFSTKKRKFIIADTPGHEQYTRNMVTGASTANLTIILIDARKGVQDQSRRHAYISSLLGIKHFVVAVNKMDLVEYSEERFNEIKAEFETFVSKLENKPKDIFYVPISALLGHNVVVNNPIKDYAKPDSDKFSMPWYQGPTVLDILEGVDFQAETNLEDFRFPVQYVLREDTAECPDFRGFAGQIASGTVKVGDELVSVPSGKTSKVKSITTFDGDLEEAFAPQSVTLVLEDEIDTSRGDMLVNVNNQPKALKELTAHVCWMAEEPLELKKKYLIKHTSNKVRAMITDIEHKIDINTLEKLKVDKLQLNEMAKIKLKTMKPVAADKYQKNRFTGSFIIIDELTNNTVGAAMLTESNA